MNITRVFPVNNNKQNTAFSGQKDIAVDNPLSRIPAADVFERLFQQPKKSNPINDFINSVIIRKKGSISETSDKITIPGVSDFRKVKDGTLLPKNQPVVVGKNAILSLAGITEVDLGSDYMAPFLQNM